MKRDYEINEKYRVFIYFVHFVYFVISLLSFFAEIVRVWQNSRVNHSFGCGEPN